MDRLTQNGTKIKDIKICRKESNHEENETGPGLSKQKSFRHLPVMGAGV